MVYYSGGYQFDAREKPIFDSRITKCVFRSSGDLNFVVVVEDCDIGGLGWNTYFFPNFHILNFVWETDEGKTGNIILLIFVLSGCFNCRWVRVEEEVSLGPAEIASFCSCFFSQFGWAASPKREWSISLFSLYWQPNRWVDPLAFGVTKGDQDAAWIQDSIFLVSGVNQGDVEVRWVQDFLVYLQGLEASSLDLNGVVWFSVWGRLSQ